jgi:hypothetical protein
MKVPALGAHPDDLAGGELRGAAARRRHPARHRLYSEPLGRRDLDTAAPRA